MSVTTPEKQQQNTSPKKKTPKKDKTPNKTKTPRSIAKSLDDASRKVKFSPKVMLFEGKMSLAESKAGLPTTDSPDISSSNKKKSNLKRNDQSESTSDSAEGQDSAKKTLDFEAPATDVVDKKVVKLKEKIKKRREMMKAMPNRKGLGYVDPKTKTFVIKKSIVVNNGESGGGVKMVTKTTGTITKLKKKAKAGGKVGKKTAATAATKGEGGKAKVAKGERKANAAGVSANDVKAKDAVLKVKKRPAAEAEKTTPQKKGEKRKRERDDEGGKNNEKVVVVEKKIVQVKKPAAALSTKVYQQFHGKVTLTENKQKLFSMKKKERKTFRQQQKLGDNWSQMKEIKMIWESLRRASLDVEKRRTLCDAFCAKAKGHVKNLAFMHDCSRALQCLVKHATAQQRDAIFAEIEGDLVEMSKNKYAKNFIKRLMDKGSKEQRRVIMASFATHVPEMAKHVDASSVLEYGVNNFSNAAQRRSMVEEFYGPGYVFHKTVDHQSLEDLFAVKPASRDAILEHMKVKVLSHVEKPSFTHIVVQKATLEFLRLAQPEARREGIENMRDALVHILHSHEGARIALLALWHGTAKDRKAILKSFKSHVVKIATDEHGYQVLLGAIDVTDDTKMISKALIEELAASSESLEKIMDSKHGRTVIYYLIHHRDPRHVHPDLLAILKDGDDNATSKKDPEVRRRELAAASLPHLLRHLATHVPDLINTKKGAVAVYTILEAVDGSSVAEAQRAFDAVIDLVAAPFDDAANADSSEEPSSHPIANAGGHLCVKKIIQQNSEFAHLLLAKVTDDQLRSWASVNRGCYVLLALLEHLDEAVGKRLGDALEPLMESLSTKDFSGAKVLTTKLTSKMEVS